MQRLPRIAAALGIFAASTLACLPPAAHATDFKNAQLGQPIADNLLGVGNFQVQLPPGRWVLITKLNNQAGTLGSGHPAPPTQILAAARAEGGRVVAVVSFAAPETSYMGMSRWSDDPCKAETAAVVKDTLEQTIAMPECFAINHLKPDQIEKSRTPALVDMQKWAKDSSLAMPPGVVRVNYVKYHGGDFLRVTSYLAGAPGDIPATEPWGRAAVASLSPHVRGKSAPGVLPALPAFVK